METNKPKYHFIPCVVGAFWVTFQLYIAVITPLHPLLQIPLHLLSALALVFWYYPAGKGWWRALDVISGICLLLILYYFVDQTDRIQMRIPYVDNVLMQDYAVGAASLLLLLEAVRRVIGMSLYIFILIFIAYAGFGDYFPGWLKYSGIDIPTFTDLMIMGPDGIFGLPLGTSVNYLFYFILFGSFFSEFGGGQLLIDLGMSLSTKQNGAPAKAAVLSSALMGMMSGSAVANVSTTGVMTIPLMKKVGYTAEQAASIEAVASTGGQIMPPIMGVGAFIMADMLGIKYGQVALAAIIPAFAYFFSIFVVVGLLAKLREVKALVEPLTAKVWPRLYLLLPAFVTIYYISFGYSLMTAALRGTLAVFIVSLFDSRYRFNFRLMFACLQQGLKQCATVAVPIAASGLIIGVAVQSGLAQKFSSLLIGLAGTHIVFSLLMTMLGCLVLGMALPTVAAYVVGAVLFVPSLIRLDIPPLAAHMFIFYFGIFAQITPPVCLASFTAAGIAGSDSWKTGWLAFSYALIAFLTPFVFVLKPEILLIGTLTETAIAAVVLLIGTYMLACSYVGFFIIPLRSKVERAILFVLAILTIMPHVALDIIGVAGFVVLGVINLMRKRTLVRSAGLAVEEVGNG